MVVDLVLSLHTFLNEQFKSVNKEIAGDCHKILFSLNKGSIMWLLVGIIVSVIKESQDKRLWQDHADGSQLRNLIKYISFKKRPT